MASLSYTSAQAPELYLLVPPPLTQSRDTVLPGSPFGSPCTQHGLSGHSWVLSMRNSSQDHFPTELSWGAGDGQAGRSWPPSHCTSGCFSWRDLVVHCHLLSDIQRLSALSWIQQQWSRCIWPKQWCWIELARQSHSQEKSIIPFPRFL